MKGGKRPGAGRPKGTPNPDTVARREFAAKAAAEGITPLEVMLRTMRDAWDAAEKVVDPLEKMQLRAGACTVAKDAAPYLHARLAQIEQKTELEVTRNTVSPEPLPADEWERTYGSGTH